MDIWNDAKRPFEVMSPIDGRSQSPGEQPIFDDPRNERLAQVRQAITSSSYWNSAQPQPAALFGRGKWLLENPDQMWQGDLTQWGAPGPYSHSERTCIGLKLLSLSGTSEATRMLADFHQRHSGDQTLLSLLTDDEWYKAGIEISRGSTLQTELPQICAIADQPTAERATSAADEKMLLSALTECDVPDDLNLLLESSASSIPLVEGRECGVLGRFIDNCDGTVTDTTTGLMWMRCAMGQTWLATTCVGEAMSYTWDQATALRHSFAGYDDWQLPGLKELQSIVNEGRADPSIDTLVFPITPSSDFWTATANAENPYWAWSVRFNFGRSHSDWVRTNRCHVRLVRSVRASDATLRQRDFPLRISHIGTGSGVTHCDPEGESYVFGTRVDMHAVAADDSVFVGWSGDCSGADNPCSVIVNSAKAVTAEFVRRDLRDLDIGIAFESTDTAMMNGGESAYLFYVTITNRLRKQVRVELPLASYVTVQGEEIEQDVWLRGLLIGGKGAAIRSGTFKKAGIVFYVSKLKTISQGDRLYVNVVLPSSSRQFNCCLICTDQVLRTFSVIEASANGSVTEEEPRVAQLDVRPGSNSTEPGTLLRGAEVCERLELLECKFVELLSRMESLLESPVTDRRSVRTAVDLILRQPALYASDIAALRSLISSDAVQVPMIEAGSSEPDMPSTELAPTYVSLIQFLSGLTSLAAISLADLRSHLLPLDLLPSAVIEDVNEKAFDLVGGPALEEDGERVIVFREVLAQVLERWDTHST